MVGRKGSPGEDDGGTYSSGMPMGLKEATWRAKNGGTEAEEVLNIATVIFRGGMYGVSLRNFRTSQKFG